MEMQAVIKPEIEKSALMPGPELTETVLPPGVSTEAQETTKYAISLYDKVQAIAIVTPDDYRNAGAILGEIKAKHKYLEDTEESIIKPLRDGYNASRKRILDFFSPAKEKLAKARDYLGPAMVKWTEEQEARRREEERRLQEEARKRAEEETLRQAIEAEEAGEKEEAEQIMAEPVYVPSIRVASEIPKSKGSHIRTTWSAEGFDLLATVKAIADGKAPLQAVKYDLVFLNSQATDYNLALNIPGVRAVSKKTQI